MQVKPIASLAVLSLLVASMFTALAAQSAMPVAAHATPTTTPRPCDDDASPACDMMCAEPTSAAKTGDEQLTPTLLTLTVSKTVAAVGEKLSFVATLRQWDQETLRWISPTLPYGTHLDVYHSGSKRWGDDGAVPMSADGKATFELSVGTEPSTLVYFVYFSGDSTLNRSQAWSPTITTKWRVEITITYAGRFVSRGVTFYQVWGYLKDHQGNPLMNRDVEYYMKSETSREWRDLWGDVTLASPPFLPIAAGFFSMDLESNEPSAYFKVTYGGDDCNLATESAVHCDQMGCHKEITDASSFAFL